MLLYMLRNKEETIPQLAWPFQRPSNSGDGKRLSALQRLPFQRQQAYEVHDADSMDASGKWRGYVAAMRRLTTPQSAIDTRDCRGR